MIDLYDTAELSNTTPFIDTYGSSIIYGAVLLYNDSTRSGSSAGRRILKFSPSDEIPLERTLTNQLTDEVFILASPEYDSYRGQLIRVKYPSLKARVAELLSINDVLLSNDGTEIYVDVNYLRRTIYEDQSEFGHGVYIYFSSYYDISYGDIVKVGNSYYRARSDSRIDELGLHVVEAVQLDSPVSSLDIHVKGTYDPVTETDDGSDYLSTTVFIESASIDFVNLNRSFVKVEDGDKVISVSKSDVSSIVVGSTIGSYNVVSVTDRTTFWSCHCRI